MDDRYLIETSNTRGMIMELVLWLILIAIGIVFMFSIVIKAVKFIKTDKIHATVREKKLRERQLEEGLDRNNK
tara:strand:- start:259 stop:477 length:219 start_codon:yes stop_codon:yes gene_type:complete